MRDVETALDEALAQTFPASDPIACTPKSVAELRVLGRASQGAPRAALRTSGREQRRVEGSADAGAERAARADGATALAVLDAKRGNAPGAGSPVPIEAESPWATTERPEPAALRQVRALERIRIEAIRRNDVNAMLRLLDPLFICITDCGDLFDRDSYIGAVRSHQLSYDTDLELTETDHRVDGDVVIVVGMMHGHARLEGDMQVFRHRSMRVWRGREGDWKLLAWQSSRREGSALVTGRRE